MRLRLLAAALLALGMTACSAASDSLPTEPTEPSTTTTAPKNTIRSLYIKTYDSSGGKLGPTTIWYYELSGGTLKVTEKKRASYDADSEVTGVETIRVRDEDLAELEELALAFVDNPDIGPECTDVGGIDLVVKDGSRVLQEAAGGICSSDPNLPAFQIRTKLNEIAHG